MRRLRLAVLFSLLLLTARTALAATVAIARPARASADLEQSLVLIRGELLSVGLEVLLVDRPAIRDLGGTASEAWVHELVTKRGVDAVIDVDDNTVPAAVDVWVADKTPGQLGHARVPVEPTAEKPSERLAIRTLEVLRSRFLEIDLMARGRRASAGESTIQSTADATSSAGHEHHRVGLEAGVAVVGSVDRVGYAILPVARVDWAPRPWLRLQATAAGLGTRGEVSSKTDGADLAQWFAVLGACYRLRAEHRLRPLVALSAGLLHTTIEGRADPPRHAHLETRWSFLLDGSVGAELGLGGRYTLTVAAHVHAAAPYVKVQFVDDVVASSGHPNLLLSMAVGAWL